MTAFVIARVDVKDPEQYEKYKALAPIAIEKHGGEYLARGGALEMLEGPEETRRVVILRFPSMDAARAFYDSPDYTKARAAREGAAEGQFMIVEGL